jgi:acyl-CoA dehydrogenase
MSVRDEEKQVMTHFNSEHQALREQIRRFVDEVIRPNGEHWEKEQNVPRSFLKQMGELGFLGIGYPEEYGGSNMDVFGWIVLLEELGRSTFAGVVNAATVHAMMAGPHLLHAGNEQQKQRYLPGVISGDLMTAIAISEADAASDVSAIQTSAKRHDGQWKINGSKFYISNGVNADLYFVAAKTDPLARGTRGISMFIVEKNTPGFSIGRKLEKMGFRSSDTAELVFQDCLIPDENLLGEEGRGFYSIIRNFQLERLVIGCLNVSESLAALRMTVEYLRQRKTFGLPLIERQALRQRIAMMYARVEAGRQLVYFAATLMREGKDATREVSMVKAYWGELVNEVMYTCVQFHGGAGFLEGTIARMYRDVRLYSIGGGTTEIMLEEIAKRWDDVPEWT